MPVLTFNSIFMKAEYIKKDGNEDGSPPLDEKVKENIRKYVEQGKGAIDDRIMDLDSSWDAERALQLNIALLVLGSFLLYNNNKRWLIISIIVSVFLAQNAVQGSCAPLKFLKFRGDFDNIKNDIEKAWEAVKDFEKDKKPIGFTKNI
jgi:hypothetical protein